METKTYKDSSQAQYKRRARENLGLDLPKGMKEIWKQCAAEHGMTLTSYLSELIKRDNPEIFDNINP